MAEIRVKDFDDRAWYELAGLADARGCKVADLLNDALLDLLEQSRSVVDAPRAIGTVGAAEPSRPFDMDEWRRRHTWGGELWPLSAAEIAEIETASAVGMRRVA